MSEQTEPICSECKRPIFDTSHIDAIVDAASELTAALSRVKELEKICTIDGIEDLIKTRDDLTADNARLRELLRDVTYAAVFPIELQQRIDKELKQ